MLVSTEVFVECFFEEPFTPKHVFEAARRAVSSIPAKAWDSYYIIRHVFDGSAMSIGVGLRLTVPPTTSVGLVVEPIRKATGASRVTVHELRGWYR